MRLQGSGARRGVIAQCVTRDRYFAFRYDEQIEAEAVQYLEQFVETHRTAVLEPRQYIFGNTKHVGCVVDPHMVLRSAIAHERPQCRKIEGERVGCCNRSW